MNLAKIVATLHKAEKHNENILQLAAKAEVTIARLKEQIACHVDAPNEGESPVTLSLRHGMFMRRHYMLHPNGKTTRCWILKD